MRKPQTPPDTDRTLRNLKDGDEFLMAVLRSARAGQVEGRYLHWDKLRRLAPPATLTHDEWWLGVKLQRRSLYKKIPLLDKDMRAFRYVMADPMAERLHEITLGAGGRIQVGEGILNEETRDDYYVDALIRESITSSQLEGATTTRRIAQEMLSSGRDPRDKSERMIFNNFVTMKRIGELRNEPLSKQLVLEIHRIITMETLDAENEAGRFRRPDEKVRVYVDQDQVVHIPPDANELEARMQSMCDFANCKTPPGFLHPVLRSIILHFWLAYDHPFVDGNGRTARAIFYWSMLRHGFGLFEYLSISEILLQAPVKYTMAYLYTETDDNDLTYFILYQLEVIRRATEQLEHYIKRKTKEIRRAERALRGSEALNYRQRALVGHALRHPHFRYTIRGHQTRHNVTYQTSRVDLLDLAEKGVLEKRKVSRTWVFFPVTDLESALGTIEDS